jgi:hypothetical protein
LCASLPSGSEFTITGHCGSMAGILARAVGVSAIPIPLMFRALPSDIYPMSTISSISPSAASSVSSSAASALDQQTIAALQIQLTAYTSAGYGQNTQAKAAYQALQSAINSGNVTQAQAALITLQRVSQSSNPASSVSNPSVDNDGDHDGSGLNVKA